MCGILHNKWPRAAAVDGRRSARLIPFDEPTKSPEISYKFVGRFVLALISVVIPILGLGFPAAGLRGAVGHYISKYICIIPFNVSLGADAITTAQGPSSLLLDTVFKLFKRAKIPVLVDNTYKDSHCF